MKKKTAAKKVVHSRKQSENGDKKFHQVLVPKDQHRLQMYKSGQAGFILLT